MSTKVYNKSRINSVSRPEESRRRTSPPPKHIGAPRPSGPTTPQRRPAPLKLPKNKQVPFAVFETDQQDLEALQSVIPDQVNYEIAELYSTISKLAAENNSTVVRNGLKALEEQIRLREYLHVNRTSAI